MLTSAIRTLFSWLPGEAPVFIYSKILGVPVLRTIRDALIRRTMPGQIERHGAQFVLNPSDTAVSASLAFGLFEPFETNLFCSKIRAGMTVVDIGANIGYYTVLGAQRAAPGQVIAYEPSVENHHFLERNIERNKLSNVTIIRAAVSNAGGTAELFLTASNKGTHSLANNRADTTSETVATVTLDESLAQLGIKHVDLLKIDIEGAEPLAFDGMKRTLANNPNIIIFSELYPKAIRRLGRDPLAYLQHFTDSGFSVSIIDENKKRVVPLPPRQFADLLAHFPGGETVRNLIIEKTK